MVAADKAPGVDDVLSTVAGVTLHARHLARRRRLGAPRVGSISMVLDDSSTACGVALDLDHEVLHGHVIPVDGWEVEVAKGESVVVARGSHGGSPDDVYDQALPVVLKALDLLAVLLGESYSLKSIIDPHSVWYSEGDELVVRVVVRHNHLWGGPGRHEGRMVLVSSAPLPQPLPKSLVWHESFRYYRLSQTTDDLFDAYRNMYLALESVLSVLAPPDDSGKKPEAEGIWMRRALTVLSERTNLKGFAEPGSDPVDTIMATHYSEIRSGLSHAKVARQSLFPQRIEDRTIVSKKLGQLAQLYTRAAEAAIGMRSSRGALYAGFMREQGRKALDGTEAYLSQDEAPLDLVDPTGLPPRVLIEGAGDAYDNANDIFLADRLWRLAVHSAFPLERVARAAIWAGQEPVLGCLVEPIVTIGWADTIELLVGMRGASAGWHRSDYRA